MRRHRAPGGPPGPRLTRAYLTWTLAQPFVRLGFRTGVLPRAIPRVGLLTKLQDWPVRPVPAPAETWRALRRRPRPSPEAERLVVAAIFRDEASHLAEWLDFHRLMGVERFLLFDNDSADDGRRVLAPYVEAGVVDVEDLPGPARQHEAYERALRRMRGRARWVALIDVDEFLFAVDGRPLPETLRAYEGYPGVAVRWGWYGTGGHDEPQAGTVRSYLLRSDDPVDGTWIKSVVDPERVLLEPTRRTGVHHFAYRAGFAIDEHGDPVLGAGAFGRPIRREVLRINHYVTRSRREGLTKLRRRRGSTGTLRDYDAERWVSSEGHVRDDSALRAVRAAAPRDPAVAARLLAGDYPVPVVPPVRD